MFLKQSTAATIILGPFVDSTDGVTAETALTISQADVRLSKNAGAFAQKNDANAATHMENGYYSCALSTTDTNTLGRLRVAVAESGALPVWVDFLVMPANVYDSLLSTDYLQVHAVEIANDLITAAAIAADAIGSSELAATAAAEIADAVWDEAISGHLTAGSTGEALNDAGAAGTPPTVGEIADAVWDEALSAHSIAGSTGEALNDAATIPPTTAAIADAVWDEATSGHTNAGSTGLALGSIPTAAAVSDAVWDEAISGHATAGSTGEALADASAGSATAADIADAVWDEALSGHLTAGSTGDALNDAGGAAADPWNTALPGAYASGTAGWIVGERLDAKISAISGNSPGSGATEWTYTLTEAGSGDPIADADVWVSTDSTGSNVIASGRTNASGVITFYLDPGTVYVWRQKSGYNFTNPDVEVVA